MPKGKSLLTDSQVRKIYESRLPEFRKHQKMQFAGYEQSGNPLLFQPMYRNIIPRTIEEKRAIVYKMKAQYLNHKTR